MAYKWLRPPDRVALHSSPCVVFLGKAFYPRSVFLHLGVLNGTGAFDTGR